MRIAIFENVMTAGGHEVDFNRILVEEFRALGHEVIFYVPENFKFQLDYQTPVVKIRGNSISYTNTRGIHKIIATIKREINRQRWYSQLFYLQKQFDALIIPTATYRYLRALNHNALKKISVPLIFILHGINPTEAPKFLNAAEKLLPNKNVKMAVISLADDIFGRTLKNINMIYPPTYIPRDLTDAEKNPPRNDILTVGFFGQYRREKKLRDLLDVFVNGKYNRKVQLIVQGSTMHNEDAEDFEKIISKYKNFDGLKFMHKGLIGADWQRAIMNVDALLMPYSAPRYLYHVSAMLFTAIGFGKPVIAGDNLNPEIFATYKIGETFESGDLNDLANVLENFINNFDNSFETYERNLREAGEVFSPNNFAKQLEDIILNK